MPSPSSGWAHELDRLGVAPDSTAVARSNDAWAAELSDGGRRDAAAADLRDFLRRTLARGFGRQLSDADLDDLAQTATMNAIERREEFRGNSRFTTWAASIAVNAALGELRRARHAAISLDDAVAAGSEALQQSPALNAPLQRGDAARVLNEAIAEVLSDAQREALLAELGGLPLMEIAKRTGRTRGALYKLLHDARKRLRKALTARGLTAADLVDDARTEGES